jgi:ribosomal protein L9
VRRELVSREVVAMTNTAAAAAALFQSVPVLDIIRRVVKREVNLSLRETEAKRSGREAGKEMVQFRSMLYN